jgi:hypothetical protein
MATTVHPGWQRGCINRTSLITSNRLTCSLEVTLLLLITSFTLVMSRGQTHFRRNGTKVRQSPITTITLRATSTRIFLSNTITVVKSVIALTSRRRIQCRTTSLTSHSSVVITTLLLRVLRTAFRVSLEASFQIQTKSVDRTILHLVDPLWVLCPQVSKGQHPLIKAL